MRPHVYFIRSETGAIKIGFSRNPSRRIRAMKTTSPDRLTEMVIVPGSIGAETWLHEKFARHRLHGEWFNPDAEILEFVSLIKEQGEAVIPPEFRAPDDSKLDKEKKRRHGITLTCRELLKLIVGGTTKAGTIGDCIIRAAELTGLSERTIKSIWYSEHKEITAYEYLTIMMHFRRQFGDASSPEDFGIRLVAAQNQGAVQ